MEGSDNYLKEQCHVQVCVVTIQNLNITQTSEHFMVNQIDHPVVLVLYFSSSSHQHCYLI